MTRQGQLLVLGASAEGETCCWWSDCRRRGRQTYLLPQVRGQTTAMLQGNHVLVAGVYALRWSCVKAPSILEWMLVSLLCPACKAVKSVYANHEGDI